MADLPAEIRRMIWHLAVPDKSRIMELSWNFMPNPADYFDRSWMPYLSHPQRFRPPNVLHICSESRQETIDYYIEMNSLTADGRERRFYINPKLDVLHIDFTSAGSADKLPITNLHRVETLAVASDVLLLEHLESLSKIRRALPGWKRVFVAKKYSREDLVGCSCPTWPPLAAPLHRPPPVEGAWVVETDDGNHQRTSLFGISTTMWQPWKQAGGGQLAGMIFIRLCPHCGPPQSQSLVQASEQALACLDQSRRTGLAFEELSSHELMARYAK